MRDAIYRFFGGDPAVAWLLTAALCFVLAVGYVWFESRRLERQRAEAQRQRLRKVDPMVRVSRVPPKASGYPSRRVG